MNFMISVEEALRLSVDNTLVGQTEKLPLSETLNRVLSEDIYAAIDLPSFRNSAMDGYALLYADYKEGVRDFNLVGEIEAGNTNRHELNPGQAYRIFTGAPVPDNCDLVIMQENTEKKDGSVKITELNSTLNQNIRSIGEQVKTNDLALKAGTRINPATIGYLTSLGVTEVRCHANPRIAIVSTGDELVEAGTELKFGQIYESNSAALIAALKKFGIERIEKFQLADNYKDTEDQLAELLSEFDYVLASGGISVGDYDFVGKALKNLGVEQVFYKVKQKPGKPLFFGRKENCHVFALPGNPAAALSCLHIYVKSSLQKFTGDSKCEPNWLNLTVATSFIKKGDRAQFLKATITDGQALILDGQSSNMMHTFAISDALVFVPADVTEINSGETVKAVLL